MLPLEPAAAKAARRIHSAADLSVRYLAEPRLRPTALPIGTWWWDGKQNFGDRLTDFLLPNYGIAPYHASRKHARLFGVGSTVDATYPDYSGYFWGTGKYMESDATHRKRATFLAVRGPLTRDLLDLPASTPLGDPGLLVSKHVARITRRDLVGIVPHFTHWDSPEVRNLVSRLGKSIHVIDVRRPTVQVVREISACSVIIATSLHGLITADAYDIPAMWAMPDPVLTGGDFKFRDYEAVVTPSRDRQHLLATVRNMDDAWENSATVSREAVRTAQDALEAALQLLLSRESLRASPYQLPWHVATGLIRQW